MATLEQVDTVATTKQSVLRKIMLFSHFSVIGMTALRRSRTALQ
ncbi:MAG: hypothetical protein ACYC9L_09935 [Sulfuricaulis sp.]